MTIFFFILFVLMTTIIIFGNRYYYKRGYKKGVLDRTAYLAREKFIRTD